MKYINKLTYCFYDGFMEMDNIYNNYDSALDWKSSKVTDGKVG